MLPRQMLVGQMLSVADIRVAVVVVVVVRWSGMSNPTQQRVPLDFGDTRYQVIVKWFWLCICIHIIEKYFLLHFCACNLTYQQPVVVKCHFMYGISSWHGMT